jgi:hypothetical protein
MLNGYRESNSQFRFRAQPQTMLDCCSGVD